MFECKKHVRTTLIHFRTQTSKFLSGKQFSSLVPKLASPDVLMSHLTFKDAIFKENGSGSKVIKSFSQKSNLAFYVLVHLLFLFKMASKLLAFLFQLALNSNVYGFFSNIF